MASDPGDAAMLVFPQHVAIEITAQEGAASLRTTASRDNLDLVRTATIGLPSSPPQLLVSKRYPTEGSRYWLPIHAA